MTEDGTIEIQNGNGVIRVQASEYRGEMGLDIRRYYLDDQGEWKPTRKGIRIPEHLVEPVLSAMVEASGL